MALTAAEKSERWRQKAREEGKIPARKTVDVRHLTPEQTAELEEFLGRFLQEAEPERGGRQVEKCVVNDAGGRF